MKTLTLTPEKARNLYIPATRELLTDWYGPVGGRLAYVLVGLRGDDALCALEGESCQIGEIDIHNLSLDLSNPAVIDRMYRVFAAGEKCSCDLLDCGPGTDGDTCEQCKASGWLRPPTDLSLFRGVKAEGWGPELEAALLWASWVRMAAGLRPLGQVWGPWDHRGLDQHSLPGWERPIVAGPAVMTDNPGQWPRVDESQDPTKYNTFRPFRRRVAAGEGPSNCIEVDAWLLTDSDWGASALLDITPEGPDLRALVP